MSAYSTIAGELRIRVANRWGTPPSWRVDPPHAAKDASELSIKCRAMSKRCTGRCIWTLQRPGGPFSEFQRPLSFKKQVLPSGPAESSKRVLTKAVQHGWESEVPGEKSIVSP